MIRVPEAANTRPLSSALDRSVPRGNAGTARGPSPSSCPHLPAGWTDQLARTLAHQLQQQTALPIVVDNRPGMSGTVGTVHVAKGTADGLLLMITNAAPTPSRPSWATSASTR